MSNYRSDDECSLPNEIVFNLELDLLWVRGPPESSITNLTRAHTIIYSETLSESEDHTGSLKSRPWHDDIFRDCGLSNVVGPRDCTPGLRDQYVPATMRIGLRQGARFIVAR